MNCAARFKGIKKYVSQKGTTYADIYCHGILSDGTEDIEQSRFRTFSLEVISRCSKLNKDDAILLDLSFKEATVKGVTSYDEIKE